MKKGKSEKVKKWSSLRSRNFLALGRLHFLILIVLFNIVIGFGQRVEHYNSPLYSPKVYDPAQSEASKGLPNALKEIGIEQKLNEQLPLETEFKDSEGKTVKIGDYFGKRPVILALVYYECPMLCSEVLNGMTGTLKSLNFSVGKEFDVVALSFDANEYDKTELARNKKESYVRRYARENSENGWHFLTGTQENIDKITKAVGFSYKWDEETKQFAHAGAIMVLTPEGKMSKYLYGIDYAPKDVKFAIMESAENKVGNPVDQLLLYCFHYNPATGKYGLQILNVIRLAGLLTLFGMGTMFFVFWRRNKNKRKVL